jgi:hypothetical protein
MHKQFPMASLSLALALALTAAAVSATSGAVNDAISPPALSGGRPNVGAQVVDDATLAAGPTMEGEVTVQSGALPMAPEGRAPSASEVKQLSVPSVSFRSVATKEPCLRQSVNKDYCGPEANRAVSTAIPDFLFGPFRGVCANHDFCYFAGGQEIVRQMEQKYRMSMISATRNQKDEFKKQMKSIRASCDKQFRDAVFSACKRVPAARRLNCAEAAAAYWGAVRIGAGKAFERAVDVSFTCRM